VFQDLRNDSSGVWQDETSRDIARRYLDPHQDNDARMLAGLNELNSALDESASKLETADGLGKEGAEHAERVAEGLEDCDQELRSANAGLDDFAELESEARSKLPVIHRLVSEANSACSA